MRSLAFIILLIFAPMAAQAATVQEMVERINQRYDDFFRWHRENEERIERLQQGRAERKKSEREWYARMEKARLEFVKAKKPRGSDEHLRLRWEAEEKARREEHELLRQRYVHQRDEVEKIRRKGRMIPELKEYGLEGY